jgi:hypothetical protein
MVARGRSATARLPVASLDRLARQQLDADAAWAVHSVFARACNLAGPGGELLGIVEAAGGNGPATLVLAEGTWQFPFSSLLAPGEPATLHGDRLAIGSVLRLDLADTQLWQPAPLVRTLPPQEVARRVALAAEIGLREAGPSGLACLLRSILAPAVKPPLLGTLGTPLTEQARGLLTALLAAIYDKKWADAAEPAGGLSGLGPGLTPAGDDLLAGLALGLRAARGDLPAPLAAALAGAVVGRTTDLAAARVRHAVAGHPDERTQCVLSALVMDPSADGLAAAVRDLLKYGHSSGADTLVGIVAGLVSGCGYPPRSLQCGTRSPEPVPPT